MNKLIPITLLALGFCFTGFYFLNDQGNPNPSEHEVPEMEPTEEQTSGAILLDRIKTPAGFQRLPVDPNSFKEYLRTIPLKPQGAEVSYYSGGIKSSEGVYTAVIDLEIGDKNLHQCADAVMRLRAEYLWNTKQYDQIHFNFTNGFKVDYSEWMKGRRMVVEGNKTYWDNQSSASNSYEDFWEYMELIFMYAGTASLEKELISVPLSQMEIGDVFIKGGYPGHAVLVMDMADNEATGKKIYLLAQSYMPAQESQILINPIDSKLSPWYVLDENEIINTPEWDFSKNQLKRFKQ